MFATATHSRALYTAASIAGSGGRYVADGELEMKGIRKPLKVAFEWQQNRIVGSVSFKRLAFDIGTGEWAQTELLSDDVELRFDVQVN